MILSLLGSAATTVLLLDGAASSAGGFGAAGSFLPILLMFGIFYFLLIRPQQKKQRDLQEWLKSIKVGDEVVTTGGLWGRVSGLSDSSPYVKIELQDKVRVRVLRSHIAGKAPSETTAKGNEQK